MGIYHHYKSFMAAFPVITSCFVWFLQRLHARQPALPIKAVNGGNSLSPNGLSFSEEIT
jgi:hypothetical protein